MRNLPLWKCFNPRPAVKPGETSRIRVGVAAGYVSIRARRLSRARPNNTAEYSELGVVSIRARRLSRARPRSTVPVGLDAMFQSAPGG